MMDIAPRTSNIVSTAGAAASRLHHIVIVGGGAGGLELATRLGDKLGRKGRAKITLVDRSRTHVWKPLLHEIAAGSLNVGRDALDYLAQGHGHGFQFRYGGMTGIDRSRRLVHLAATHDEDGREITPERSFAYDTLVVAIGSEGNDFGTSGVMQNAIMLDTPEQAQRFNRRLINACIRAFAQPGPVQPGQLHVAIIGAGATGAELAAELHHTTRELVAYGLDKIDPDKDIQISLIEAGDRILPALPEHVAVAAGKILEKLHIDVRTRAQVIGITPEGVKLASGAFIVSELVVWAAGVKGPAVLGKLDGLEVSPTSQLVVKPTLQTTRADNIFAFGDCSYFVPAGQSRPVPPRAQAAHQQASHLVAQIQRRMNGQPLRDYVYRDLGTLVALGDPGAVGSLMGMVAGRNIFVEGRLARLMYLSLHKMHELALHGAAKVFLDTAGRLLTRRSEPRIKLH